jgi:hypothetical protein
VPYRLRGKGRRLDDRSKNQRRKDKSRNLRDTFRSGMEIAKQKSSVAVVCASLF